MILSECWKMDTVAITMPVYCEFADALHKIAQGHHVSSQLLALFFTCMGGCCTLCRLGFLLLQGTTWTIALVSFGYQVLKPRNTYLYYRLRFLRLNPQPPSSLLQNGLSCIEAYSFVLDRIPCMEAGQVRPLSYIHRPYLAIRI